MNGCENNIAYWEESKQSEGLPGKCDSFYIINSWWVWEQAEFCNLYNCNLV